MGNDAKNTIRNSLVAGSVAGITSTSLFHPFDVVRTKMQSSLAVALDKGVGNASKAAFTSPFSAFMHTVQNGGYRSLYTGLSLPVAAQAVYKATVFTVNTYTRTLLLEIKTQNQQRNSTRNSAGPLTLSSSESFLCGTTAGAVNAFLFVSPVEFVRNQLIAQHSRLSFEREKSLKQKRNSSSVNSSKFKGTITKRTLSSSHSSSIMRGPLDVIRIIVKRDGLFGLWRGTGVTVARDSIGCGFFFLSFELCKHYLRNITGEETLATSMISGSISGVAFWTAALPFDTMKTLVQNGSANNMVSAMSQIGGLRNLCKGWQVALGKGAPGAAVTVGTYEFVTRILERK